MPSAIAPGLAHDALVVKLERVEQDQRHRAVRSLPLGAHRPDTFVPVARAGSGVEDGGVDGPGELADEGEQRQRTREVLTIEWNN